MHASIIWNTININIFIFSTYQITLIRVKKNNFSKIFLPAFTILLFNQNNLYSHPIFFYFFITYLLFIHLFFLPHHTQLNFNMETFSLLVRSYQSRINYRKIFVKGKANAQVKVPIKTHNLLLREREKKSKEIKLSSNVHLIKLTRKQVKQQKKRKEKRVDVEV